MNIPDHILTKNFIGVPREYFNRIVNPSLQKIQDAGTPFIKTYSIAGKNIRVECYGELLAEKLSLALSHHKQATGTPELTIFTWDQSTTGEQLALPWQEKKCTEGNHENITDKNFFGVYIAGEESLNFYDKETSVGYFCVRDAKYLPDWAIGAPFRTILHWFLNKHDTHLMHGAVIGHHGNAVLLTAKGGSGKSTTALSCFLEGMDYLADDYAAITAKDMPTAHSLYHSAKVTKQGLELFPELKKIVWNKNFDEPEKAIVFLSDLFPGQVKTSAPLRAILIPKITGKETRIMPASKMEAFLAVAPTTLLQLPWAGTEKVTALKSIIEKVPCYFLELGSEIRKIPDVVKLFLDGREL